MFIKNKKWCCRDKSGQVTIFIIIALIIVVIIILVFMILLQTKRINIVNPTSPDPQSYIESCTRDAVIEAINIIQIHGGDIKPKGSVDYEGNPVTYLCYTGEMYKKCINQRPMLVEHIEKEITGFVRPIVEACYLKLVKDIERRSEIELGDELGIRTMIHPREISVEVKRHLKIKTGEQTQEMENVKMNLAHPMYEFSEIAMEIVNQETEYCNFDVLGFMILYPDFDIKGTITGDYNTIYIIEERATKQKFQFATKSCELPPGF